MSNTARMPVIAWIVSLVAALGCHATPADPSRVVPNDNRAAAGTLAGGVLTLALEVREGRWYPDGQDGPPVRIQAFAESGGLLRNPGPLIRVPTGTRVQLSIHNALHDSVLVLHGMHTRPDSIDDTVQVAPGATRQLSFAAGAPGTYFYWGSTTHTTVDSRGDLDSQLQGAFIIDPSHTPAPADRIFVLGGWISRPDSSGAEAELKVINGLSWPHTERLSYAVGDTIRWRWIDPTDSPHPMHLHGFYFDVTSHGTWLADTAYALAERPHVVTEMPLPGETFAMQWIPVEPGNWLFHCHVAFHTSLYLSETPVPDPKDPMLVDAMHGMRGMVLALSVTPGISVTRRPESVAGAREIRLVAQAAPLRWHQVLDEMAFVRQDGPLPPAPDSVPPLSSPLVLYRGEPVRITIVNHLRGPTAVHWHGIEVPAYSDGVPNWSGIGAHRAPAIAPGDSFVAAFTPTRAGTFIYHAHSNEEFQVNLGLYGSLLVVDSAQYDPASERVIILGGNGPVGKPARINGREVPDTVRMTVGRTYRIRLIDIIADWTARITLLRGDSVLAWRALARDGAELPANAQVVMPATMIAGPGQTMDFEYRPTAPGSLRLEVKQRTGGWKTSLPIKVVR